MNNLPIISGEASETDSEEELPESLQPVVLTPAIHGAVVTGEDTESENEIDLSVCSAASASNSTCDKYDSLLHQKLRECNGKLHQDIEGFCQNIIGEAKKNLSSIDQQLVKSQLTLQGAVTSLKSLAGNSLAIRNKLQLVLSAQFLPNIKVDM